MLNFLYPIFLKLYLSFWVLRGSKTRLDWSEPWIELLRVGLYLKNKCSCLNSKGQRCPTWYNPLNPFGGLNSQVETWGVDIGERLAPNHYKFFVFVVLASLFLFFVLFTGLLICVWLCFYCKLIHFTLHLGTLLK